MIHDYMDLHRELHPVDFRSFSQSLTRLFAVCLCLSFFLYVCERVSLNETENCVQPAQNNHNHILDVDEAKVYVVH